MSDTPVWRTKKYSIESLTRRFRKMFHVVVMSGRSSFVQDRVLSISCPHHFDAELIRDVLEVGGARLFVELIGEVGMEGYNLLINFTLSQSLKL